MVDIAAKLPLGSPGVVCRTGVCPVELGISLKSKIQKSGIEVSVAFINIVILLIGFNPLSDSTQC